MELECSTIDLHGHARLNISLSLICSKTIYNKQFLHTSEMKLKENAVI